jgi:hypothetical protein
MITECPHCQKKLKLSPKIEEGLRQLDPGKSIRINCPQCAKTILLDAGTLAPESSAATSASPADQQVRPATPARPRPAVTPPPPPDLAGLETASTDEGEARVDDVPKALILMPDSPGCRLVAEALETLGYQPSFVQSAEEAMEKMQFVTYASVILHSQYEDTALENSPFHQFMCAMNMNKRRYIFYMLIGPEFHTLYDLQALASSSNIVINDKDLSHLPAILRKTIPQYEGMFGAIMQETSVLDR